MGGDSLFMLTTQDRTPPEMSNFCEENRLRLAVHPPYSLDLASSDFFLFGISSIVCRESLFHHVKNYFQQFMNPSGHPATNLGRRVSVLDGEARMDFSEQW
jgi:hypothetical protein